MLSQHAYVAANHRAWEAVLSQHAMQFKTFPIKEAAEVQNVEEGEGRDFSGSLA